MRFLRLYICILSIVLLCLSCTKDNEETLKITLTDIKFDTTDVNLIKGETKVLTVYYEPEDMLVSKEDVTLQYSKDDIVVVSLDSIGNGKAVLKVYARDTGVLSLTFSMVGDTSKKAIAHIRVLPPNILAEGIQLDKAIINIRAEQTDTIKARIIPQNATDKSIVWSSDNEEIVQVSKEGVVTALEVGKAIITASLGSNAKISATCKVVVLAEPDILVNAITLDKTKIDIARGQKDTLKARVSPANATDKTIVWTSDNEEIAQVSKEGVITAIKQGEATITASSSSKTKVSATCRVKVFVPVQSITLDETNIDIDIGKRDTLKATIIPIDADNTNIIWTSSNENIATVSDGVILGINKGDITITATSESNPLIKATCQVKVLNNKAEITFFALDRSIETEALTRTKTPYTESFPMEAIINEEAKMIVLRSAYFDALSSFSKVHPVFTLSTGASVKVRGTTQESGKTEVNFSSGSVQYVVTSEDGKLSQTYTVNISHHDYAYIPDANFRKWLTTNYNTAMKGDSLHTVHTSVTNATDINVNNKSIAELTGIGFFTKIETLQCNTNNLTSIDLTQNKLLEELYCARNVLLTSIDVTKNTALKKLDFRGWLSPRGFITSIDLTQNKLLEELICTDNRLTRLDLTKNVALKKLTCDWNDITSIDLTQNKLLEELDCSDNKLTRLDVTKNVALKKLNCAHTGITSIDLTQNKLLEELYCSRNRKLTRLDVTKNTLLKVLYCEKADGNGLTNLDLTKNKLLKKLNCNFNKLTSLDVTKNTLLEELYCNYTGLDIDVSKNTDLRIYECIDNGLTNLDLSNNLALKELTCYDNQLISIDLRGIRDANSEVYMDDYIQQLTSVYVHENLQNHQTIKDIKTAGGNNVIIKTYSAPLGSTTYTLECCDYDPLKNTNPCNIQPMAQGACPP